MDGTAVPLYIKHNDLPSGVGTNIPLELCRMFNVHIPDQTLGAQLVKGYLDHLGKIKSCTTIHHGSC